MIDPGIRAAGARETRLLAEIRRRGLRLVRLSDTSRAIRVFGPGVDIFAEGLHCLSEIDLQPTSYTKYTK